MELWYRLLRPISVEYSVRSPELRTRYRNGDTSTRWLLDRIVTYPKHPIHRARHHGSVESRNWSTSSLLARNSVCLLPHGPTFSNETYHGLVVTSEIGEKKAEMPRVSVFLSFLFSFFSFSSSFFSFPKEMGHRDCEKRHPKADVAPERTIARTTLAKRWTRYRLRRLLSTNRR